MTKGKIGINPHHHGFKSPKREKIERVEAALKKVEAERREKGGLSVLQKILF